MGRKSLFLGLLNVIFVFGIGFAQCPELVLNQNGQAIKLEIQLNEQQLLVVDPIQHAKYTWIRMDHKDQVLQSAAGYTFRPQENGIYAAIAKLNACTDTSNSIYFDLSKTFEDRILNEIKIYPNPVTGNVTIDLGKKRDEVSILIRDGHDKELNTLEYQSKSILKVQLEGEKGLYVIEILTSDGQQETFRIVKQ